MEARDPVPLGPGLTTSGEMRTTAEFEFEAPAGRLCVCADGRVEADEINDHQVLGIDADPHRPLLLPVLRVQAPEAHRLAGDEAGQRVLRARVAGHQPRDSAGVRRRVGPLLDFLAGPARMVGAEQEGVAVLDRPHDVFGPVEPGLGAGDADVTVAGAKVLHARLDLAPADVALGKQKLPVEI